MLYGLVKADHMIRATSESIGALMDTDYKDAPVIGGEEMKVVRRLTPKECLRLQGFPDDWLEIGTVVTNGKNKGKRKYTDTNGKERIISESDKYKAIGNSIATGKDSFWMWVLKRISAEYDRTPTMASLFDGIGGFPLCWEQINGPGTALWASEIEEFPIAVTKGHFPERQMDIFDFIKENK